MFSTGISPNSTLVSETETVHGMAPTGTTFARAMPLTPAMVADMSAGPGPTAVNMPDESTVATDGLLEAQIGLPAVRAPLGNVALAFSRVIFPGVGALSIP